MARLTQPWDYLIITASNEIQSAAYQTRVELEKSLGLLSSFRNVMVVADPEGKRIGSGGSTILCLMEVLNRELESGRGASDPQVWRRVFSKLRILIIHAGGDSKRLPAYSAWGKICVPLPTDADTAVVPTLLDRELSILVDLPSMPAGAGQVVVACGDALLYFDPDHVRLAAEGITAVGCLASPSTASKHGVYCTDADRHLTLYLQKPTVDEQYRHGAVNYSNQAILDISLMIFDAGTCATLLQSLETTLDGKGRIGWTDAQSRGVLENGLDLYSEVCAAMGTHATPDHYRRVCRVLGSKWSEAELDHFYDCFRNLPVRVHVLARCGFLHFGTTRQLIASGSSLLQMDRGFTPAHSNLLINNRITEKGQIAGDNFWVESCNLNAKLELEGQNVVVGVDVGKPLRLPKGACLSVVAGVTRARKPCHFVLCYGIDDQFKDTPEQGATFCNLPLLHWLEALGAKVEEVWAKAGEPQKLTLWDARVFPAVEDKAECAGWVWMLDPAAATPAQKTRWRQADRYSLAEMVWQTDLQTIAERQARVSSFIAGKSLDRLFRVNSNFSARELAWILRHNDDSAACVAKLLADAERCLGHKNDPPSMERFVFCRIMHSLGSAVDALADHDRARLPQVIPGLPDRLPTQTLHWLDGLNLGIKSSTSAKKWAAAAQQSAFDQVAETILYATSGRAPRPKLSLRPDETVWGRAPARLELGGGWTDTPPFCLEHGGSVINVAINLNGQPPIHCYARVTANPVIRLNSIDLGETITIADLSQLMDYRNPQDGFALVKAALAVLGFSPAFGDWPESVSLEEILEAFGGGLEITTLVGIPKGSGLGTSSIVGAAIVGVIYRLLGRPPSRQDIFHDVLRLEQALTTGGGWQDQVGGGVEGTKLIVTKPGLFPQYMTNFVPSDVLDPRLNGGTTLLYYTGLTRLAKNILRQIVGGYLDRDRGIMRTLADEFKVAEAIYAAMSRKDAAECGHYLDEAWRLQKRLCRDVSNPPIESLLERIRPRIHGARILGAGSGGFVLMVCKSANDAAAIRQELEAHPLNDRSRFFDYDISSEGLVVTSC